jgi:hypothetical protein
MCRRFWKGWDNESGAGEARSKAFFFEKKKQKTSDYGGFGLSG